MSLVSVGRRMFRTLDSIKGRARNAAERAAAGRYLRNGRKPWSAGYGEYRRRYLRESLRDSEILARFRSGDPLPERYGFRLDARVVEIPWVLSRLDPDASRLLDAGSSLNHDFLLESKPLSAKHLHILTFAPESSCFCNQSVSYIYGDIRDTVFREASFDEIVCISVIEHVGMDNSMYGGPRENTPDAFLYAVDELKRTLRPGGTLLMTFPFGRYENHGWFQQLDADHLDRLVGRFAPTTVIERIYRYMPEGWTLSNREESSDCRFFDVQEYVREKRPIDYPSDFAAAERAVACLELIK